MQTALTIAVPSFVIILGILYNNHGLNRLETRMDKLESRMDKSFDHLDAQIDGLRNDIKEFYRTIGQHDARLDALERNPKQ
jgi:hypothetical protein